MLPGCYFRRLVPGVILGLDAPSGRAAREKGVP